MLVSIFNISNAELFLEMTKFPKFIGWFRWAIDCAPHRLPCGFLTSFRSGRSSSSSSSCCSKLVDDFSGKGSMAWRRDVAGRAGIGGERGHCFYPRPFTRGPRLLPAKPWLHPRKKGEASRLRCCIALLYVYWTINTEIKITEKTKFGK